MLENTLETLLILVRPLPAIVGVLGGGGWGALAYGESRLAGEEIA